ncbi:MAG: ABC transporter substrate-binding protein [Pseudomonadota bacterium]
MRKALLTVFLAAVLFLPPLPMAPARAADAPIGPAEAAVADLNQTLLKALHSPAAKEFGERVTMLHPLMVAAFDYPFMARIAAGRYWDDFTEAQRKRYVALFTDLAVAVAASRFKAQPDAAIAITGTRDGPRETRLVETRLTLPGSPSRDIAYLMRQDKDGSWRAIDVFFEARVSELSTKRSEYTSVLGKEGIPAFLDILQDKLEDYDGSA